MTPQQPHPTIRLVTLGDSAIETPEARIDQRSPIPLLAALYVIRSGGRVSRARLAGLLWPDGSDDERRHRLRTLLHRLRRMGLPLDATPHDVSLAPARVDADYAAFSDVQWTLDHMRAASAPSAILPLDSRTGPELLDWLEEERDAIARVMARGLLSACAEARAGGEWAVVERCAQACRTVDPLNEEAHLALAEALSMTASRARALAVLDEYARALGEGHELRLPVRLLRQRIAGGRTASAVSDADVALVGRSEVRRSLVSAMQSAFEGRGGVRVIRGEVGMGKSRLLAEMEREVRLRGGTAVRIRLHAGDAHRPFSVLFQLVPVLLDLPGALGCDSSTLEVFRDIPELPAGHDLTPGQGAERRRRVERALIDLLDAVSQERPLTILVDDSQWMDDAQRPMWEAVLPWSASRPVLWIFAARTEGDVPVALPIGTSPPQVALSPLSLGEAGELVQRALERLGVQGSDELRFRLPRAAGGNPLVLLELARHFAETRTLDGMPESVARLVSDRLDRLSRPAMRVLQAAGLLGTYPSLSRLDAILALPRTDFVDAVEEIAGAGIADDLATGELRAHGLWVGAALARLPAVVACVLHRHAAERFEEEFAAHPTMPLLWECARHWKAAGDATRAHAALLRGAEHLAANGFFADAAAVYEQALEGSDAARQLQLMERQIRLLQLGGRWQATLDAIDGYRALATALDPAYDGHDQLELQRLMALVYCTGDVAAAAESALRCASAPRASTSHRLEAAKECAKFCEASGQFARLTEVAGIAASLPADTRADRTNARLVTIYYHTVLGDPAAAADAAVASYREALAAGDERQLRGALYCTVDPLLVAGRVEEAWARAQELVAIATRQGAVDSIKAGYDQLVTLSLEFETPAQTRVWLERFRELLHGALLDDPSAKRIFVPMYEAQLHVAEGDGDAALQRAAPFDECVRLGGSRWQARFRAVYVGAHLLRGDVEQAREASAGMADCFAMPDRWLDWPATIFTRWLAATDGDAAARTFARRFVREIRRERYPPAPELLAWATQ